MNAKNGSRAKGCLVALAMLVAIGVAIAVAALLESRPSHLFRKFIADPIPESVSIERAESRLSHAVVFLSFRIPATDLERIAHSLRLWPEARQVPIQEPTWFAPRNDCQYWRGNGGTIELWYSGNDQTAFFKQANP